jgi:hypothetical protein
VLVPVMPVVTAELAPHGALLLHAVEASVDPGVEVRSGHRALARKGGNGDRGGESERKSCKQSRFQDGTSFSFDCKTAMGEHRPRGGHLQFFT